MKHEEQGMELFLEGYNCAQAVAMAYCDLTGLDREQTARMTSSFGGGMGRLREVCGAVSGMFFVAGILYGYASPNDDEAKKAHYARIQSLAAQFREEAGSIICREILKSPPTDPAPSPRTAEYYRQRPCARMVALACRILDQYIKENPL